MFRNDMGVLINKGKLITNKQLGRLTLKKKVSCWISLHCVLVWVSLDLFLKFCVIINEKKAWCTVAVITLKMISKTNRVSILGRRV